MSASTSDSTSLKLASTGGGPAGLFTALLLKQSDPDAECVVYERNRADDTFGFGVVFSAETLGAVEAADPVFYARMAAEFRSWSAIDTDFLGTSERSDGHAFAAFERKRLLQLLAERAQEVGVDVRFQTVAPPLEQLSRENDVVIGADGVNSAVRRELADQLVPSTVGRPSKYIWLGTSRPFECFTFLFVETEHGLFWAHVYPYADGRATFIVETDEETWERAGLAEGAARPRKPGENDEAAIAFCQRIFAEHLDGHDLVGNNSGWLSFTVLKTEHWSAGNVVLAGDAVHTAHFSIGSGTKLALEDAISLARSLHEEPSVEAALKAYEADRQPAVASVQRAAQTSLEWFEGVARYRHLPAEQFVLQLLTRSQRVTYDNLKLRDADYVARFDAWLAERTRSLGVEVETGTPPMFHPYRLRGLELDNRVVVSPMAQYSAVEGVPTDWHLVHLASRAVGGAGLVMTEMTCTSPQARITPGCPGIWDDEQEAAWTRVVDVVHGTSRAKIGLQIGHAGPKGSTKVMWEGIDQPLESGGWEVVAPSPVPYLEEGGQVPRELDEAGIRDVVAQHVAAAERGARAGFDLVELHFAHGYLVSSFISPLTNHRTDGYGGDLRGRARLALEVLRAVREVWPAEKPVLVRISATDWVEGGTTGDDAVELARLLAEAGADMVDVSTGQTSTRARPAYGRLYQTPFADRIRQEVGVPTMTVGAVSSVEDVNTIVATGRADLVALARPHLVDPYWTLNAAIDQGFRGHPTPVQYRSGLRARRRAQQP